MTVEVDDLHTSIVVSCVEGAVGGIESQASRDCGKQDGAQQLVLMVVPDYTRLVGAR